MADAGFQPARKAHPALLVKDPRALAEKLQEPGYRLRDDGPLDGYHRLYVEDPFGNRIELQETP